MADLKKIIMLAGFLLLIVVCFDHRPITLLLVPMIGGSLFKIFFIALAFFVALCLIYTVLTVKDDRTVKTDGTLTCENGHKCRVNVNVRGTGTMVWHNGIEWVNGKPVVVQELGRDRIGGSPTLSPPVCPKCGARWKVPASQDKHKK